MPLHSLAAAASALGVALGVPLLLLLSRSRALKPLAAATSAAAAALKAPRVLSSSSPLLSLLVASKAATKSYKAARVLRPSSRLPSLPSSKRLKAALAAASLLRLAAAAPSPTTPTGFAALALLKSGYKLSKNSAKVLEGFLGLQIHKGIRNGVDALGVVVKVAVIASEVAVWVGVRCCGWWDRRCARPLGFDRKNDLVLVARGRFEAQVVYLDRRKFEGDDEGYRLEEPTSALLCLAVPVPEMALVS